MKNSTKTDKDGYLLLEKEFEFKGFKFEFIKDLEGGWKIYKKTNIKLEYVKFELILPKRREEFNFHGNIIPKKFVYPGSSSFGKLGFDCISLELAEARHKQVLDSKEEKEHKDEKILNLPDTKFTLKDLLEDSKNKKWKYSDVFIRVKKLLEGKKIKVVGEKDNVRGKPSKIYQKI